MKCDEMQELLSLYIDNELEENEIKAVEEHLSICGDCRREYNELKEMTDLLRQAEMVPVPDAFSFRLKKALKEEKQSMIDAGIIARVPAGKKNRWRIIASVAAVFMVGVLSFGFYDEILGTLTGQFHGQDQAGKAQVEEPYSAISKAEGNITDSALNNDASYPSADSSSARNENDAAKKKGDSGLQPTAKATEPVEAGDVQSNSANNEKKMAVSKEAAQDSDAAPEMLYKAAGVPDANTDESLADSALPNLALSDGGGSNGTAADTTLSDSAPELAPEKCSRSLTDTGIDRSASSVKYYEDLIKERLADFDYQILSSEYTQGGERRFEVFIFRDKDGNTYNEKITIIGKNKEIKIVTSNEFTELFNDENDNN